MYGGAFGATLTGGFGPEMDTCLKNTKAALVSAGMPTSQASSVAISKCLADYNAAHAGGATPMQISAPMAPAPSGGVPTLVWVGLGVVVVGGAAAFFLMKKKKA